MVVGRLNRESNPVPGEKPGFTPQHKLPDGSFIDTGETNPLPTNDDLVYQQLESLKQLINDQQTLTKKVEVTNQKATQTVDGMVGVNNFPIDQKVSDSDVLTKLSELDSKMNGIIDGSTPANTQIVGNIVTETIGKDAVLIDTIYNAVAVTSTAFVMSQNIDVSGYTNLMLLINNSHEETFICRFYRISTNQVYAGETGDILINIPKVTTNRHRLVSRTELPLLDKPLTDLMLGIKASTSPTTGSITITLFGEPR